MDRALTEMVAIENAVEEANENAVRELSDTQLALIGGGAGDTIMH